jgi:hypothetical protein
MTTLMFDVTTDGQSKDCDGIMNHRKTRKTMTYDDLASLIGGLVIGNNSINITRDAGETWVEGYTKTEEGYTKEEIWYAEIEGTEE